jgi:hypothetical protein
VSHSWYLRCIDDGAQTDDGVNHGEGVLRALANLGPQIVALDAADTDGLVELRSWAAPQTDVLPWLGTHGTHLLELVDEYGEAAAIDKLCPAIFDAIPTPEPVACGRSAGHLGGHEARVDQRLTGGAVPVLRSWTVRW